jgi:hypothetical protein
VWDADHPNADAKGYVTEHVRVASAALGKGLPPGSEVHHVNGVRDDNRNCNLVVCQDVAYHRLLHARLRALQACGNPVWRPCSFCGKYDALANMWVHPSLPQARHRTCNNIHQREWQRRKRETA